MRRQHNVLGIFLAILYARPHKSSTRRIDTGCRFVQEHQTWFTQLIMMQSNNNKKCHQIETGLVVQSNAKHTIANAVFNFRLVPPEYVLTSRLRYSFKSVLFSHLSVSVWIFDHGIPRIIAIYFNVSYAVIKSHSASTCGQ